MQPDARYPIGRFQPPSEIDPHHREQWIAEIERLPADLRRAVEALPAERLDTPYREDGWTVRQVVHHVADSHLNAYVRFRLALTEDEPTIKPYVEASWAELEDARTLDPEVSLRLLEALHARWVALLRSLEEDGFRRRFRHPEHGRTPTLEQTLALYAWHGRHHVAHVEAVGQRGG
jgi:uncharacterized damage-inducible protein DinB